MRIRTALAIMCVLSAVAVANESDSARLGPGDHARTIESGGRQRRFLVHVPAAYDAAKPIPVVLALHGAAMTGEMMARFSGMNETADRQGFVVVYPSGTGTGPLLTWNAGGFTGRWAENRPDDVRFIAELLDDLAKRLTIDPSRVYACGMSNGGMMCYRLAAELSDRIAAIAPVAGTIAIENSEPKRPVPVLHIHGRQDRIVPFDGPAGRVPGIMRFRGVDESIRTWVKIDGCEPEPRVDRLSKPGDSMTIVRKTFGGGRENSEVVLVVVEEGGHTWPGRPSPAGFVGKSATNVSANELIWDFFRRYRSK